MNNVWLNIPFLLLGGLCTACNGAGANPTVEEVEEPLVAAALLGHTTAQQFDQDTGLHALTGDAICDVDAYKLTYSTLDPHGNSATATEGVFVPSGSDPRCQGNRPVVVYAHGTARHKSFNMADISGNGATETFNNPWSGAESWEVVSTYAAHGYIVVTPNHLGYDTSSLTYHPYLLGEAQAIEVIDGLRAARDYLNASGGPKPSGKLFLTGHSEGGYVAMATDKVIQRDYHSEFKVAGSVPISGPYNLVGMGDVIASGLVNMGGTVYISLLLTAYQKAYGNIYHHPSDIYQSPYDATIEGLFPTDTDISTLVAQGKLPALDPAMNNLFGLGGLMKPTFAWGFANSNFRKALVTNTLAGRDGTTEIKWSPNHPMALCGGQNDPMVFWGVNTPVAAQVLSTPALPVAVYNLEDRNSLPPSSRALYDGFQQAKIADFFGVLADYHGVLLPRYCHALARSFFESL